MLVAFSVSPTTSDAPDGSVSEAVAQVSPRVTLVLKADIRPGWTGQMTAKVERVETRLRRGEGADGGAC